MSVTLLGRGAWLNVHNRFRSASRKQAADEEPRSERAREAIMTDSSSVLLYQVMPATIVVGVLCLLLTKKELGGSDLRTPLLSYVFTRCVDGLLDANVLMR